MTSPSLRQAVAADLPGICRLLQECGLPVDDLTDSSLEHFLLYDDGPRIVGVAGLQVYDYIALLRSLAVANSSRERGLGRALIDAIVARATTLGVKQLWLLTTDANEFFADRDFTPCDRDLAPESIRNTAEFSVLCPGDAYLMSRQL